MRCCARAPPASAHSSPTCATAPPLLPSVILTCILMASSVLLQAIVEVVEACMKGEGANARKHVRLRTPHPSPCLCRTYPVSMLALQVGVGPSGSC